MALVVHVTMPSDSDISKKEHNKVEKYQGLKKELERTRGVKASVAPVVIGACGAETSKLGE